MEPIDYLKGVRERWRMIAVITGIAFILGTVAGVAIGAKAKPAYKAMTFLVQSGSQANDSTESVKRNNTNQLASTGTNLTIAASYINFPQVEQKVATALGLPKGKNPPGKVTAKFDPKTNQLGIGVTLFKKDKALKTADLFAQSLIDYLKESEAAANAAQAHALNLQIAALRKQIAALDKKIAPYVQAAAIQAAATAKKAAGRGGSGASQAGVVPNTGSPADPYITERGSALGQLSVASTQLDQVNARVPDAGGISIFQPAKAQQIATSQRRALVAFPIGALILGVLGFFGACVLALIGERMHGHLRSRAAVERTFGVPVLAEIPYVRMRRRASAPSRASELNPQAADAYRLLGASLTSSGDASSAGAVQVDRAPKTVVVTSSGPEEGTSMVVAELAASFAEAGKRVLVLSCDFRNPGVHRFFSVPNENGLSSALMWTNGNTVLDGCVKSTGVLGLYVVPSGPTLAQPNQLLALPTLRRALVEARTRFDLVLIDTPPILTGDMTFLLPGCDSVLVVARSGKTEVKLATRSAELLRQLNAPVIGVALNGSDGGGLPSRYYNAETLVHKALRVVWSGLRPVRWAFRMVARALKPLAPLVRPLAPVGRLVKSVFAIPYRAIDRRRRKRDLMRPREIRLDDVPSQAHAAPGSWVTESASAATAPSLSVSQPATGPVTRPVVGNGGTPAAGNTPTGSISLTDRIAHWGFPRLSRRSPDR